MKKRMIILTSIVVVAIIGVLWHKTRYVECPRCGAYVAKSEIHYVPERDDIELICPDCGYPFYLTDKHISADGSAHATITADVWQEDYEHYKNGYE